MKIAFLTGNLCDGGAQRVISVVANELAKMGNDVMVIVFAKADKEYLLDDKVKRITLYDSYGDYKKVSALKRLGRIRGILKDFAPNAAIGFLEAGYALFLSSIGLRFSKIGSLRTSPYYQEADKSIRGKLERIWFRNASAVVLQTNGQKEYAIRHGWANPTVISNPINPAVLAAEEHCYRDSCNRLIMVGRLSDEKNYPLAFIAFQKACKVIPDLKLEVYGDGEIKNKLIKLAADLELQNKVSFMGWRDDVVAAYEKSDLFLMTSDFEGLPNALMEAMGCGLLCISTDCPTGPADLIKDEYNGVLVPTGDVDALADTIIRVCRMSCDERKIMGIRAKNIIAEYYNAWYIARKWENLIGQLEKSRGKDNGK